MSDTPDASVLLSAVLWLQNVLLGPIATAIAIIAVAGLGYMALSGRIDLRRGASVVIGCFVMFGAPTIARGIQAVAGAPDPGFFSAPPVAQVQDPVIVPTPAPAVDTYDPYAGASVAQHQ